IGIRTFCLTFVAATELFSGCKAKTESATNGLETEAATADEQASENINRAIDALIFQPDEGTSSLWSTQNNSFQLEAPFSGNPFTAIMRAVQRRWISIGKNPCRVLNPLIQSPENPLLRPYFFVGGSAEAGAGVHGVAGMDYVWDFYNLQMGTFKYKSLEVVLGSGTVGSGINSYMGLAFGIRSDVNSAWSGRFASTGLAGSLPVLADYLSVHANFFAAQNNQGKIDPGFAGATIGLSAALSLPTSVPGALQVSNGYWIASKEMNNMVAKKLSTGKIPHGQQGNSTCDGKCIRIDYSNWVKGYTGRSVNLIRSIHAVLEGLSLPANFENIVLLALAVGAYRDSMDTHQLCRK
ncbi:hypothetical protein EBR21_01670, partial [bacterium]|nr:hypothetical protein [bacterium]